MDNTSVALQKSYELEESDVLTQIKQETCDEDINEENVSFEIVEVKEEVYGEEHADESPSNVRMGCAQDEQEIDYEWNEAVVNEPDPLALHPDLEASVKSILERTNTTETTSNVLQENGELFHCEKCGGRKFTTFDRHQEHIENCLYSLKLSLNIHNRSYTGLKKKYYKCILCDYSAFQGSAIKVHMRGHTVERPYKCTVCNYTAVQITPFNAHMRRHTSVKPYKCTLCRYSAARATEFDKHMRRHAGENPY